MAAEMTTRSNPNEDADLSRARVEEYIKSSLETLLDESQLPEGSERYIEHSKVIQDLLDQNRSVIGIADLFPSSRKRKRDQERDELHYRESINGWTSGALLQPALIARLRSEIVSKTDPAGCAYPQALLVLQDLRTRFSHIKIHCAIAELSTTCLDGFVMLPPNSGLTPCVTSNEEDTLYTTEADVQNTWERSVSWRLHNYPKAHVIEAQRALHLNPNLTVQQSSWKRWTSQTRLHHSFAQFAAECPNQLWSRIGDERQRAQTNTSSASHAHGERISSGVHHPVNICCILRGIGKMEFDKKGNAFFILDVHLLHRNGTMFYPPSGKNEETGVDIKEECRNIEQRCAHCSPKYEDSNYDGEACLYQTWSVHIVFPGRELCKLYPLLRPRAKYVITNLRIKKSPFDRAGSILVFQARQHERTNSGGTSIIDIFSTSDTKDNMDESLKESSGLSGSKLSDYRGALTAIYRNAIQLDNHPQLTLWMVDGWNVSCPRLGMRCGAQVTAHNVQCIFLGEQRLVGFAPITNFSSISLDAISPHSMVKSPPVPINSPTLLHSMATRNPAVALWIHHLQRLLRDNIRFEPTSVRGVCEQSVEFLKTRGVVPEDTYVMSPVEAVVASYVLINEERQLSRGCCNWNILTIDHNKMKKLTGFSNYAVIGEFTRPQGRNEYEVFDRFASIMVPFVNGFGQALPQSSFIMLIENPVILVEEFTSNVEHGVSNQEFYQHASKLRHCFGVSRIIQNCLEVEDQRGQGLMAAYFRNLCSSMLLKQISLRSESDNLCVLDGSPSPDVPLDSGGVENACSHNASASESFLGVRECLLPRTDDVCRILTSANLDEAVEHISNTKPQREVNVDGLFLSKTVSVTNLRAQGNILRENTKRIRHPPALEQLLCGYLFDKIKITIRLQDIESKDYVDIVSFPKSQEEMPPTLQPGERVHIKGLRREVQHGKIALVSKRTPDITLRESLCWRRSHSSKNKNDLLYLVQLHSQGRAMGLDLCSKRVRIQLVSLSWFTMKWIDVVTGSELYPTHASSTSPKTTLRGTSVKRIGAAAMDPGTIAPSFVFTIAFFASDGTSEIRLTAAGFQAFRLSGLSWSSLYDWATITAKYGKLEWNSAFSSERKASNIAFSGEQSDNKIRTRLDAVLSLRSAINQNLMGVSTQHPQAAPNRTQEHLSSDIIRHEFNQAAEQVEGALPVDRGRRYLSEYDPPYTSPWYDCWVRFDFKDVWKLASKSGILDDNIQEVAWRLNLPDYVITKIYEAQWNSMSLSQRPNEYPKGRETKSPPSTLVPFSLGNQVIRTQKITGLDMKVIAVQPVYAGDRLSELHREMDTDISGRY